MSKLVVILQDVAMMEIAIFNELLSNGILSYKDSNKEEIIQIKKQYEGNSFIDDPRNAFGYEIKVLVQSIDKEHSEYLVNFELLRMNYLTLVLN